MQPLFVFEPRYRAMTQDALAGEKRIAIAMLRPGYEPLYFSNHAPIHPVAGLGKIVAVERLCDDKYNLLVRGEARVRLVEEVCGRTYRRGQVQPVVAAPNPRSACPELRATLRDALDRVLTCRPDLRALALKTCDGPADLAQVTDCLAAALPLPAPERQGLLAEGDAVRRACRLVEVFRKLCPEKFAGAPPKPCDRWELN